MPLNSLFPQGTQSEQTIIESLIIDSIRMYGKEFFYIPRTLVNKDEILGEDSLSKFKNAFPIECYLDNIDNFGGQGAFISKFGLNIEEQAQLTIARKRWEELVGQHGRTIIPERPCEGDLIYFPLNDGLFEIKFVDHQNPFYQLGRLYVYKLKIELFQYSSESIETDIEEIDKFSLDLAFNLTQEGSSEPTEHLPEFSGKQHGLNREYDDESDGLINKDEASPF